MDSAWRSRAGRPHIVRSASESLYILTCGLSVSTLKYEMGKQDSQVVVGVHGQWTDIKEFGPVLRTGCFRFPLFGDSTFEGEMLNGRRFGNGVQV